MGPFEVIPPDAVINVPVGGIPVYLEDRTVIGRGYISEDGRHLEIEIDSQYPIAELMKESLVGFSVVNLAADRSEDIINNANKKEKTDD